MPRWLLAFIIALVLPCYGLAAAGQPLRATAGEEASEEAGDGAVEQQPRQACPPTACAPTAGDAGAWLDDQPGQHDASDDVSSPPFQVMQAPSLPRPGSLALRESAPPFLEGVMRPPSPLVRPH